jgi:hypothetical protein
MGIKIFIKIKMAIILNKGLLNKKMKKIIN